MKLLNWSKLSPDARSEALKRPANDSGALEKDVAMIVARVRKQGDMALRDFTRQFDGRRP